MCVKDKNGTTSTALGKQLASDALDGDFSIIEEAVKLTCYEMANPKEKNIRAEVTC